MYSRRIRKAEQNAAADDVLRNNVARRSRNIGYYRAVAFRKKIQYRGFARIRFPAYNGRNALAYGVSRFVRAFKLFKVVYYFINGHRHFIAVHTFKVFVGKIYYCIYVARNARYVVIYLIYFVTHRTVKTAPRKRESRICLCVYHSYNRFRLCKRELACAKRPSRKLSRSRLHRTAGKRKGKYIFGKKYSAVTAYFHDIFTRIRARSTKKRDKRFVEKRAVLRLYIREKNAVRRNIGKLLSVFRKYELLSDRESLLS